MIKQIKQKSEKKFFVVHWGWIKLWLLFCSENLNRSDESLYKGPSSRSRLPSASSLTLGVQSQHLSASNPDLSALSVEESIKEFPDMVVKVYKADQTFKYLAITKVSIWFIHWYISCLKLIEAEFFSVEMKNIKHCLQMLFYRIPMPEKLCYLHFRNLESQNPAGIPSV